MVCKGKIKKDDMSSLPLNVETNDFARLARWPERVTTVYTR